jgi:hypothetical protein
MREKAIALFLTAMLALITIGPVIAQTYTLGDYSKPFCTDGDCKNFRIVYGSNAKAEDLAGGSDVIARLSGDSYTLKSTGATTDETTIEGESFRLDASGNEWNYNEDMEDIDNKLTSTDMTFLADGTFDDNKGTNKGDNDYTQKIEFIEGTGLIKFDTKEGGDKNADTYLYFDDSSSKYMYVYTLDFATQVVVANAADLEQNDITIMGTEYNIVDATVSSAGAFTKLVLMGGTSKVTGNHGETFDVTVGDTTYSVTPNVYSSSSTVIFDVTYGGTTETTDALSVGDTYELGDGNLVGLTQMATSAKEGVADTATFFVGANKLTLQSGKKVQVGDEKIDGSTVYIGNSSGGNVDWDTLNITYVPEDDVYLAEDEEYTDPIFGAFKFMFLGMDKTTEHIDIDPEGSTKINLKTTNYDGNEMDFTLWYCNSTACYLGEDDDNQIIITDTTAMTAADVAGSDMSALEGIRFLYDFNNIAHLIEITDIDTTDHQVDFRVITQDNKDYEDNTYTSGSNTGFSILDATFTLNISEDSPYTITFQDITDNSGGVSWITTEYGALIKFSETHQNISITEVDGQISTNCSLVVDTNISLTWDSTNSRINIGQPSGGMSFKRLEDGDNYNNVWTTTYGTYWLYNSDAQGYIDIDYPDEEADAKVYFASTGATTTTTEGTEEGTIK